MTIDPKTKSNAKNDNDKDSHFEAMTSFLSRQTESVRKNATIISNDQTPQPFLLHVTMDKPKAYIPKIGYRQGITEDRTVPRISASTALSGCFIGFAALFDALVNRNFVSAKGEFANWNGIGHVNMIPFMCALRPNHRLVYDVVATNEHWLVNYTQGTDKYVPEEIGTFFVPSLSFDIDFSKDHRKNYTIFINTTRPIIFNDDKVVEAGYYSLVFTESRHSTYRNSIKEIEPISRSDFHEGKTKHTAKLAKASESVLDHWV